MAQIESVIGVPIEVPTPPAIELPAVAEYIIPLYILRIVNDPSKAIIEPTFTWGRSYEDTRYHRKSDGNGLDLI